MFKEIEEKIYDEDNFYNNDIETLSEKTGKLLLENKSLHKKNIEILNEKQWIFEDKNIKKYEP